MTDALTLAFRLVTATDRPRVLEIAAQVWDGSDYVPDVLDDWLADDRADLIGAFAAGELVGFARCDHSIPRYAWFEGLRTDPAWRGRGVAKALTGALLELARRAGAQRIGLSTYIDNLASQRVSAGFGFSRVAGFIYLEAPADGAARAAAAPSPEVVTVSPDEAQAFMAHSAFLAAGSGFLPHGWRFYPFAAAPELAVGQMAHRLGLRDGAGRLTALLCSGRPLHGPASFSVDFLDGDPAGLETLLRHALSLARECRFVEAMLPPGDDATPAGSVYRRLGWQPWNDWQPDVFIYERGG